MVGEQSDWANPRQTTPIYDDIRSSDSRGAFMGTSHTVTQPTGYRDRWPGERHDDQQLSAVLQHDHDRLADRPEAVPVRLDGRPAVRHAHPVGSPRRGELLFADGSVQFLKESLDLVTFKNLVDRDDGNVVQWQ